MECFHRPVLVDEAVKCLIPLPDGTYIDGTCGTGGHSLTIVKRLQGNGRLICLDRDPEAVRLSRKRLSFSGERVQVIRASYTELDKVLKELELDTVDGVLLDLGMSSYQLERSGRGFSFGRDEPLDMRMDPDGELTAYDLVNTLSLKDLEGIFREYGEEKRARLIARAIIRARRRNPIETSLQLALLTKSAYPPSYRFRTRHPATRIFQALRIAVNRELENLNLFLDKIPFLVAKGGRLVILTYHSLEDRIVKQAMAVWEKGCTCPPDLPYCACGKVPLFRRLFRKAIQPTWKEIDENPSARSAKLRAAERI